MSERPARQHLNVIDGLRGIAVLMVLLYHLWLVYGTTLEAHLFGHVVNVQFLAETGFLGVEVFFFLSGFCLFYPYAVARLAGTRAPTLGEYAYRRAIKILPSYVVALTVISLLHDDFSSRQGLIDYLEHLFFVHPLVPGAFQGISGPLWTVGIEVEFYLIFPLICWGLLRWPVPATLGIVAAATAYRHWLLPADHAASFYFVNQLPAFVDMFTLGMVAAYAFTWARSAGFVERLPRLLTPLAVAAAAFGVLLLWALARSGVLTSQAGFFEWQATHRLEISAVLLLVTLCSALALPFWRKIVANPLFTYLSVISYNLYLWHLEILVWLHGTAGSATLQVVLAVAAAFVVATLITYFIERPLLRRPLPRRVRQSIV